MKNELKHQMCNEVLEYLSEISDSDKCKVLSSAYQVARKKVLAKKAEEQKDEGN